MLEELEAKKKMRRDFCSESKFSIVLGIILAIATIVVVSISLVRQHKTEDEVINIGEEQGRLKKQQNMTMYQTYWNEERITNVENRISAVETFESNALIKIAHNAEQIDIVNKARKANHDIILDLTESVVINAEVAAKNVEKLQEHEIQLAADRKEIEDVVVDHHIMLYEHKKIRAALIQQPYTVFGESKLVKVEGIEGFVRMATYLNGSYFFSTNPPSITSTNGGWIAVDREDLLFPELDKVALERVPTDLTLWADAGNLSLPSKSNTGLKQKVTIDPDETTEPVSPVGPIDPKVLNEPVPL